MIRRLLGFALAIAIVPLLLGADTISLNTATPGGSSRTGSGYIQEQGNYGVDPTRILVTIGGFFQPLPNGQQSGVTAVLGKDAQGDPQWTATQGQPKGWYNCFGMIFTSDNKGNIFQTQSNVIQNVQVQ